MQYSTSGIGNIQRYSSPTVKQHLQGEAYFIRGMLYFELVKLFGDVPLYLAPTRSVQNTLNPAHRGLRFTTASSAI